MNFAKFKEIVDDVRSPKDPKADVEVDWTPEQKLVIMQAFCPYSLKKERVVDLGFKPVQKSSDLEFYEYWISMFPPVRVEVVYDGGNTPFAVKIIQGSSDRYLNVTTIGSLVYRMWELSTYGDVVL